MENLHKYEKHYFSTNIWFLTGFLFGIVIPNTIWKVQWNQKIISMMYLLHTFIGRMEGNSDYFIQLVIHRGVYFLIMVLCGFTIFGVVLARMTIFCTGLEISALLTLAILQFGMKGGVLGLGCLFPHQLLYLPVQFILVQSVNGMSMDIWRAHGLFTVRIKHYLKNIFVLIFIYFAGVLLEAFANPIVTKVLTKSLKIF